MSENIKHLNPSDWGFPQKEKKSSEWVGGLILTIVVLLALAYLIRDNHLLALALK